MTLFAAMARLVLLAVSTQDPPPDARQPPVFAIQVESVVIDAFVTNKGATVRGLVARDFVLRDQGVRQDVDLLHGAPLRVILVFDTSSSMKGPRLDSLRAAALALLKELGPEDEVALMSFSDEIAWLAPLSTDHTRARQALTTLEARARTSVHDALFAALLLPDSSFRTLVILFSDGGDNTSWMGEKALGTFAERSNALIHVVVERAKVARRNDLLRPRPDRDSSDIEMLRGVARSTGGALIEVSSTEQVAAAFSRIMEDMKSRYILRYTPEAEPAPGWHTLDLALRSGKGQVRGRAGYWVEKR